MYNTSSKDTSELNITIYNSGVALINEIRNVALDGSETELNLHDISTKLEADSLIFNGVEVKEFYIDNDSSLNATITKSNTDKIELCYLSDGLNWDVDYVAKLSDDNLVLSCWAKIMNYSGIDYKDAKIKLLSGEIKKVTKEASIVLENVEAKADYNAPKMKISDDKISYTLDDQLDLKDNQVKLVNIISGNGIDYDEYYRLDLKKDIVEKVVEVINTEKNNLGVILPEGTIRLFRKNNENNFLEFMGEDTLHYTAPNQVVNLSLGKSNDISYDYSQSERSSTDKYESFSHKCIIKNRNKSTVHVRFTPYLRDNWRMMSSTHDYVKISSNEIEYKVEVPPMSVLNVDYEYMIEYRKF